MPSWESPARRMTASRMFCGRRSALPTVGVDAEADSDRTEGVLTKDLREYRDRGQEVKKSRSQEFRSRPGRAPARSGVACPIEHYQTGEPPADRRFLNS